jgi:signal transduction histidine kinase
MDGHENLSLAVAVAQAVAELVSPESRERVLERTVHLAAEVIPGAQHASVTLLGVAGPATPAATGRQAEELDRIQYEVGEGPCLDAARTGETVLISDLGSEMRWLDFRARVTDRTDVSSMFSVPLGDVVAPGGSLNLSSPRKAAFPAPSRAMALAVAAVAGAALAGAAERERAAARVAHLEEFVAALGYDLRSGMTVSLAAIDVLGRRRAQLDQPGQQALDVLVEELRSQARLLRELLELGPGRSRNPRVRPVSL